MRPVILIFAIAITLSPAGCGGKSSEAIVDAKPASFDTAAVAKAIVTTLDKNADGILDAREAAACAGLAAAFAEMDTDKSKTLSAAELIARLELYKAAAASSLPVSVYLTMGGGSTVPDAKVTLEPEPFFAGILKTATGTSNGEGRCHEWTVDGQRAIGLTAGLYRIKVEKDGAAAVSASGTPLGGEILGGGRGAAEAGIYLELKPQ